MINQNKTKITRGQFFCMILQTQIGTQLVSLPHNLQETAKGGAWISSLLMGVCIQIFIFLFGLLLNRFSGQDFYQICIHIFGKWLGRVLCGIYSSFFLLAAAFTLMVYVKIAKAWVFPKTPHWFLLFVMLLTSVYLARSSLQVMSRVMVIASLFLPSLFLLVAMGLSIANFTYPMPFLEVGWLKIIQTAFLALPAFGGFEVILFIYPYVHGTNKQKLMAASLANALTTLIYTVLVYTSLAVFAPEEIAIVPEPLIYMLKAIRFSLVERLDLIFLNLGVLSSTTTLAIYLYISGKGLKSINNHIAIKKVVPIIALIAALLTYVATDPFSVKYYEMKFIGIIPVFTFIIPVICLLLSFFRKKERLS
ncbi:spore germination protein (amino acid permease) [Seinonella peptonophila]|uniref:Spore germination protein (Amino acid permease) n=1 Tax=Seinonella peptonophila TaxID=112248 RepID=A0A1M4XJ92_9BACL|nr:GerAB/ArcD/ProY family transporter [Seinonella peptonophila]SHE93727.1 spore germination protein (amino acid permease) [Seinonella peptonophila]